MKTLHFNNSKDLRNSNSNYHIEISYGKDGKEYYNGYLANDDYTTKLFDNRESFETKEEAETVMERFLIPYAEKKGWQVRFSVEEDC